MYRLLEWAFAYDDGSGLPDAGAYAAELKNVTATVDGKPVQMFAWPGASSISRKDTLNKTNKV